MNRQALTTQRRFFGVFFAILPIALLLTLLFKPTQARAQATPTLRVMSYNVNNEQEPSGAQDRMNRLADFIVQNKIDVMMLVEMRDWSLPENGEDQINFNDGVYLQQRLAELNWPVERYNRTRVKGDQLFGPVILTRYPAVPGSYTEFRMTENSKRWVPSVIVASPLGQVRVLAIHTRFGTEVCPSLITIDNTIKNTFASSPLLIAGGDWNNSACGGGWESFKQGYQLLATDNWLDHIVTPKTSSFKISQGLSGNPGISDHPPVLVELTLKDGVQFPNPPPRPVSGGVAPPPDGNPPPAPSVTQSAPDGTEAWSYNATQGVVGPTAAWTSQSANTNAICNGKWCWIFDLSTLRWRDEGRPLDLSVLLTSSVKPSGNLLPWSNGGPTAGWEDYQNQYLSVVNGSTLWLLNLATNQWANGGAPYLLPNEAPWNNLAAAPDGTQLLSGITAGWTDKVSQQEYFCRGVWCWVYSYGANQWVLRDNSGKGIPLSLTQVATQTLAAASDGTTIASHGGPSVGWTDPVRNRSAICTHGWCWTYAHDANGTSASLTDMTWDRPDSAGKGTPYRLCESFGGSSAACARGPQPPGGQEPPPEPVRGDFNNDRLVNQADYDLLTRALGTTDARFNLDGSNDNLITVFDYNEWLKEVR